MERINKNRETNRIETKSIKKQFPIKRPVLIVLLIMTCSLLGTACPGNISIESVNKNSLIKNKLESLSVVPKVNRQDQQSAEQAVANFHQLFNEQKFEEMYLLIDEKAKPMRKKDEFIKFLEALHAQYGAVKSTTLVEAKTVSQDKFTTIEVLYKTEYKKAERQERFKWIINKNGGAKLYSYSQLPDKSLLMLGTGKKKN